MLRPYTMYRDRAVYFAATCTSICRGVPVDTLAGGTQAVVAPSGDCHSAPSRPSFNSRLSRLLRPTKSASAGSLVMRGRIDITHYLLWCIGSGFRPEGPGVARCPGLGRRPRNGRAGWWRRRFATMTILGLQPWQTVSSLQVLSLLTL